MARKTKEDTQKTVTAILDAAEEVFVDIGVANATIALIAEKAGVSKGAIYGHFKDKIDVCTAVCMRGLDEMKVFMTPPKRPTCLQALEDWGIDYMELFQKSKSAFNVGIIIYMKCEQSPEYEPILQLKNTIEELSLRATTKLLKSAIKAGELPLDIDLELVNIYIHSFLDGLSASLYWTSRVDPKKRDEYVRRMMNITLRSLQQPGNFALAGKPKAAKKG